MNFIEFKKLLKDNNIILFDYDYRNSYKNIFILDEHINNNKQIGGSDKGYYISPFIIIKKDKKKIKKIINKLVENNIISAKFLCNII